MILLCYIIAVLCGELIGLAFIYEPHIDSYAIVGFYQIK